MFNFKKTLKHDAYFRTLIIYGVIALIVGILLFQQYRNILVYIWPLLIVIMAIVGFIFRLIILMNFMKTAEFATAKVTRIQYYRGTKIVSYDFKYRGKEYSGKARLNFNKANRFLEKDVEVKLAVDPAHPVRSYIAELYFNLEQ